MEIEVANTTCLNNIEVRQPTSSKPPKGYKQAIACPEADLWKESMAREEEFLRTFEFGKIVDRPKDKNILPHSGYMLIRWILIIVQYYISQK